MGLLSKVFLLFCCMALFNFKRKNCKSECDAKYDKGYKAGYEAAKEDGCDSEYEYGYLYYEDLYSECQRDSDCLEADKPKCISGICKELSGGVLIMGGSAQADYPNYVAKMGECVLKDANNLPQNSEIGAAAVYDELVFQCGGSTGSANTDKCYIRSPSGQWTEGPSLHRGVWGLTLNKVGSTLVAIGGYISGGSYLNSVEILHPGSVSWEQQTYTINPARGYHCAVTISSTQVILAGGVGSSYLPNTDMLNLNTGSITRYADLPVKVEGPSCILYQGKLLFAGGYAKSHITSSQVFTLDYSNQGNSWISTTSMINARMYFSMNIVNGVPTVYGGDGDRSSMKSMEQYVGGVWKSQVLIPPRFRHTSVVIC